MSCVLNMVCSQTNWRFMTSWSYYESEGIRYKKAWHGCVPSVTTVLFPYKVVYRTLPWSDFSRKVIWCLSSDHINIPEDILFGCCAVAILDVATNTCRYRQQQWDWLCARLHPLCQEEWLLCRCLQSHGCPAGWEVDRKENVHIW